MLFLLECHKCRTTPWISQSHEFRAGLCVCLSYGKAGRGFGKPVREQSIFLQLTTSVQICNFWNRSFVFFFQRVYDIMCWKCILKAKKKCMLFASDPPKTITRLWHYTGQHCQWSLNNTSKIIQNNILKTIQFKSLPPRLYDIMINICGLNMHDKWPLTQSMSKSNSNKEHPSTHYQPPSHILAIPQTT